MLAMVPSWSPLWLGYPYQRASSNAATTSPSRSRTPCLSVVAGTWRTRGCSIAGVTPSRRLGLGRGADIQRPWCSLEASHGGLRHLAYGRFVHELHLLPPPGGGGVVGVEYLAEALCGRD